jgi:outer membrane protein assembly factor BamA
VFATFRWLRHRPDFYAGAFRSARTITRSDFFLRYHTIGIKGGMVYPLNRFASVGLEATFNQIHRTDLNPFLPGALDGNDWVAGARANFTYSKLKTADNFVLRGTYLSVDAQEAYSVSKTSQYFIWNQVDARRYTPVFKSMVLATRLTGGFSIGPQRRHVFMGGANEWLFGRLDNPGDLPFNQNVADFQYSTFVAPVRGFSWNARNGTQYVAANVELRLPLSRMMADKLNTNPAYSFEVVPFFDVGTVWTQGNPLSQRNPIDTETITGYPVSVTVQTLKSPFVMGAGAGARLMVVGYSMRFDLAWGIEDQTLLKPRLYLTLGKDF